MTLLIIILYLVLLFIIANIAERLKSKGKFLFPPALIYGLSFTVFCTAWTYFGSIGIASRKGIEFLPIYLGPTLFMPLIAIVLLKIIRICKSQHITNIADFISSRYGKNSPIGTMVAVFFIIGVIPYIAIQLKAISSCFQLLSNASIATGNFFLWDTTLYITIALAVFIILYGLRNIDTTETHTGIMTAVAVESIVKLVAFLVAGIVICFYFFAVPGDIYHHKIIEESYIHLLQFSANENGFSWFILLLLSGLAMILLPRQFQVAVVENVEEKHLLKATWIFPLYLFLINIFVLPIALAGNIIFAQSPTDTDFYLLSIPLFLHAKWLAVIVFIGGFSAATSMLIVETIALTNMVSNNIVLPLLFGQKIVNPNSKRLQQIIVDSRRIGVFVILLAAYIFEKLVAERFSLVSIGLISFAAVAQFAPAVILGIYWKQANLKAAFTGIFIGFACWFYMLIFPSLSSIHPIIESIVKEGLFHISILKPTAFLGLHNLDVLTHGVFWSLLLNTLSFVFVSINFSASKQEEFQAKIFVEINANFQKDLYSLPWKGITLVKDIKLLINNFIGEERGQNLLDGYAKRYDIVIKNENDVADIRIVSFVERILGGVIGAASARLMISNVTKNEEISKDEVLNIVKESQQFIELNKELRKKTLELTKTSNELKNANELLKNMDEQKDEFLYTVTHELRTPLSSIRALSEILYDNPDLTEVEKEQFLATIVHETERLSHLISQVLRLEKFESGRQRLNFTSFDYHEMITDSISPLQILATQKNFTIQVVKPNNELLFYGDRDMMNQVITNLVSNAIKFLDKENPSVAVRVYVENQEIITEIEDNGKGIEPDLTEKIFDKFFQAKNQTLKKPEGSGLGLAICHRIIELHQGKIWAVSELGKYAKFIFTLPLERIQEE